MKRAFFFGLLFATILFLWYCLEYAFGLHGTYIRYHELVSYFFAVPVVMVMASAIRYRKQRLQNGNAVRFRALFSFGFLVSLVTSLLVVPVMYLFVRWVNPDFLEALSRHAIQVRDMDADLAAQRYDIASFLVLHATLILVVGSVAAFVISIIMAAKRTDHAAQTV